VIRGAEIGRNDPPRLKLDGDGHGAPKPLRQATIRQGLLEPDDFNPNLAGPDGDAL
jgi:hypothetical protein